MAYIFLDESGDLGFDFSKTKTSRYFIITFLFTINKSPLEKIIKKIFQGFNKKEIKSHHGVLHCYKEEPKTRIKVLNLLKEKDMSIICIYLNKKKVYTKLQDEKHILYNYVANILLDRVYTKKLIPLSENIEIIASRRETNKFLNYNFKNYLDKQLNQNHKVKVSIDIQTPFQEKTLQIVDIVCWSIFRKYQHQDKSYYSLIKKKIIEENPLFP